MRIMFQASIGSQRAGSKFVSKKYFSDIYWQKPCFWRARGLV